MTSGPTHLDFFCGFPGARWFDSEDRTLTCTRQQGHTGWHSWRGFEWDDAHALNQANQ